LAQLTAHIVQVCPPQPLDRFTVTTQMHKQY
jgi:hypothetical protein